VPDPGLPGAHADVCVPGEALDKVEEEQERNHSLKARAAQLEKQGVETEEEHERNHSLKARAAQLEKQIANLQKDSNAQLKNMLAEVWRQTTDSSENFDDDHEAARKSR